MPRKPSALPHVLSREGKDRAGEVQRCRTSPTTSKRRRQVAPTRPGERVYKTPQHPAEQARKRRAINARLRTIYEFDKHRGTRLSITLLKHPAVPPNRGRQ